jgi:histidinol-phosphate aminotransferase
MVNVKFKSWINDLPEYIPGKTLEEIKEKYNLREVYKLASNENIFGPCQEVLRYIRNNTDYINYYPDSDCREIRKKIGSKYNISTDKIIIGNGTDQIIEMICDSFIDKGKNAVIADPTFLIYEKSTLKCGGNTIKVPLRNFKQDLESMVKSITDETCLFFLTNPHNPVGTNIAGDELEYVLKKVNKNILIVLDEAYYEYLPEEEKVNTLGYMSKYKNVIILRTFSKIYGLAGLRIGYGIADSEIISGLNRIRLPFNVNSVSQKAAVIALENEWYVEEIRDKICNEKEKFYSTFKKEGIDFIKSYSNFILIKTGRESGNIVEDLLKSGFIVRPGENIGVPGYIRVTISLPRINEKFLGTFVKIFNKYYKLNK